MSQSPQPLSLLRSQPSPRRTPEAACCSKCACLGCQSSVPHPSRWVSDPPRTPRPTQADGGGRKGGWWSLVSYRELVWEGGFVDGRGTSVHPKSEFRASAPLSLDMAPLSCMLGAAGGGGGWGGGRGGGGGWCLSTRERETHSCPCQHTPTALAFASVLCSPLTKCLRAVQPDM